MFKKLILLSFIGLIISGCVSSPHLPQQRPTAPPPVDTTDEEKEDEDGVG